MAPSESSASPESHCDHPLHDRHGNGLAPACYATWPGSAGAGDDDYNPSCCRFPKSCSAWEPCVFTPVPPSAPGGSPAHEGMRGSSRHSDERALLVEQIAALHEEYPDMARVLNSLTRAERIARDRCSPGQESGDNAWAMYVAHGSPMRCRECNKPAPCPTVALVRSFATPGDDRG